MRSSTSMVVGLLIGEPGLDTMKKVKLEIQGPDCADCALKVEKVLNELEGVEEARLSFGAETAHVTLDEDQVGLMEIEEAVERLGYKVPQGVEGSGEDGGRLYEPLRIGVVGLLTILSWTRIPPPNLGFDVAVAAILLGGYSILRDAYYSLRAGSVDVPVFMSIAIVASTVMGQYLSAAVVALFVLVFEFLEDFAIDRSRGAIRELMEAETRAARVRRNGKDLEVGVEEIKHTDVVLVRPGERIPVDGVVVEGCGSVNQAHITGESIPVEKHPGDEVYAGTVNEAGVLQIGVSRVGRDATIGRIIELVEDAQASKAPIQRVADRFTTYFTPVVIGASAMAYLITQNMVSAITVLIVACPCTVALATPLAVVASIGKASRRGILIKGGAHLEALSNMDTVAMDKTGTLTVGKPHVTDIRGFDGHDEDEILTCAAVAEKHSEHPLAHAILNEAGERGIEVPDPTSFQTILGRGIIAVYDDEEVILGNRKLLRERGIHISRRVEEYVKHVEDRGETVMLIAHDDQVCGAICVADVLRENTRQAIGEIRRRGIRTIMLTGDNPRTAKAVAEDAGIDDVIAEMLPEEKAERVRALMESGGRVAMVGDGVNDAPALAQASVGIAMGVVGSHAAIEAADVALMTDDLTKVPEAIDMGKRTFGTIGHNISIGVLFNIVGVALASLGLLTPIAAAAAHVLPEIGVFLNSLRLLR